MKPIYIASAHYFVLKLNTAAELSTYVMSIMNYDRKKVFAHDKCVANSHYPIFAHNIQSKKFRFME